MKDIVTEAMEKAESIGRRSGLAEAADIALQAYSVSSAGAGPEVHAIFTRIMDRMKSGKATPEEIHAQRVEGASGGDPDPS